MAISLANPVNWQSPLNRGLMSWFYAIGSPYASAGTVFDLCRRYTGTMTNGAYYTGTPSPGARGSFAFDGTDDCIQLGTNFGHGALSNAPFTYALWAKGNGSAANEQIIGRYDGTNLFQIGYNNANGWRCAYGVSPFDEIYSGSSYARNVWTHVTFTLNSSGAGELFVNGVSVATDPSATGAFTSATSLQIGRRGGDNAEPWLGLINDVRVYSRDLSFAEVKQLYLASCSGYRNEINKTPAYRPLIFLPAASTGGPWPFFMDEMSGGMQTLGMVA